MTITSWIRPKHLTNEQERATPYADRAWLARSETLGTTAEDAFVRWANPRITQRVGWDNSPLPREAFFSLPPEIKHLPDYLLWDPDDGLSWVECIGTGNNTGFKVRKSKLVAQAWYALTVPLIYFVYHSPSDSYTTMTWEEVRSGAVTPLTFKSDGNTYYFVEVDGWLKLKR